MAIDAARTNGQQYDVVITGGQVIDPANGVSRVTDVAILNGVVAAVDDGIDASRARRRIDASGQIVTPGLVDLHTHIYWGVTYWGIEADPVAARTGVTTWLDVGSAGGYTFPGFREYVVENTQARAYALLNLSSIGLVAPTWELANPDYLDVDLATGVVERNRDLILGIKARIDNKTTRGTGILPMKKARELADRVGLPLMTHIGASPPTLQEVAEYLRPGDILTHCFTGRDMRIIGPDGKVDPQIKALKDQGMVLDVGHGTGSFDYEVAEAMLEQGIPPDVISSDIHQTAIQGPMFDLPTTLSKFINLGMPLDDVIAAATINAAKAIKLDHVGSIGVGDVADIAIFRLEDGAFAFHDVSMKERFGSKLLVNTATLIDGHELPRMMERELHFWAKVPEEQEGAVHPASSSRVDLRDRRRRRVMQADLAQRDAIRFGVYLRPSLAMSRAQIELHEVVAHQYGSMCAGRFMPHATIKGFYRSDATVDEMVAALDPVMASNQPFEVTNGGLITMGRGGVVIDIQHDGAGEPNAAMVALHRGVFGAVRPLVHPDCAFTQGEPALDAFHAHLTVMMGDIPRGLEAEILEFLRDAEPVGPGAFTAERLHLVALRSDAWDGRWWETMRWTLLHSWRLGGESVRVSEPAWNLPG